jgi:hypothetical protein
MLKGSPMRNDHCHSIFISGFNNGFIAHRPAGLNDARNSSFAQEVYAVSKREEAVGSSKRILCPLSSVV